MVNRNFAPRWALSGRVARFAYGSFVAATCLAIAAPTPSSASPSTTIVISQVYGGGGSSTSTASFRNDYVELFNVSASTVDVGGWSVQYASSAGTSWQVTTLSGSIAPGHYYLIQEGGGTTNGAVLPTPDLTGSIMMSASSAKVALVSSTNALSGANPAGATVVDKLGYGTANGYETAAAGALSINTAALRNDSGCADTDNNSVDFTVGTPAPRNSASPTHSCGAVAPPNLVFSTSPSGASAGAAFTTQPVVTVQTPGGSTDDTFTGSVTLAIKSGTGAVGAALAGTTSVNAVAGIASFSDLSIAKAGSAYVLTASASGATSGGSAAFDVAAGAPAQLGFTVQPSAASTGAVISPAPIVSAYDTQGNPTPSFTGAIAVSLAGGTTGATLSGTTAVAAQNGSASFADLSVDKLGAGYTLSATSPGLVTAISASFDIGAGPPVSMAFSTQPGTAAAGSPLAPQPIVTLLDSTGSAAAYNGSVTVALKAGTGTLGAVLGGTATVTAVNGVATFAGLSVDRPGANYILTASAASLSADSSGFAITAATTLSGYTIADLGVLSVSEGGSTAYKVNNMGQVAGWSGHPFLWSNDTVTDLNPALGANVFSYSPARGLNDNGVVVGSFNAWVTVATIGSSDFNAFTAVHAFKWSNGVFTDLTPSATSGTMAVAVNNGGDIVLAGLSPSVLMANGASVPLNGIASGSVLNPADISDAGIVVGDAVTATSYTHAAMWQNGSASDLGTLPGDSNSSAKAISPQGAIVGDSYGATSTDTNTHAFIWSNGGMSQLPPRNTGEASVATGINSFGQIAGYVGADLANGQAAGALLWDGSAVRDLQTLIPSGDGWQLSAARSINDLGQIVGYGWHNNLPRAFLLTPVAVFGDANKDGIVTFADAALVMAMAAGTVPAQNLMFLDVAPATSPAPRGFGDGKLDLLDAVRILRKASSLETQWP